MRHFLSFTDVTSSQFSNLLKKSHALKEEWKKQKSHEDSLAGKTLAMLFETNSTRTRISFEVAMLQLGGYALTIPSQDSQLSRGESLADTARVISRYCDAIMFRTKQHEQLLEMAKHATIPIINGLSDIGHPCQVLADLMTIEERFKKLEGKTIAWFGDINNVFYSLAEAASFGKYILKVASKESYIQQHKSRLQSYNIIADSDPYTIAKNADVLMTDVWSSMHHSDEEVFQRSEDLKKFCVTKDLMHQANADAVFLHCLPVKRDNEVTSEVIDGPQSLVWEAAENRLHAQKSLLLHLIMG